jgi:hypothetical protein
MILDGPLGVSTRADRRTRITRSLGGEPLTPRAYSDQSSPAFLCSNRKSSQEAWKPAMCIKSVDSDRQTR